MADVVTLSGVNEMLTPTWNYLKINGRDVQVPAAAKVSPAGSPSERIPGGMGPQAADWLQRAATTQDEIVITSNRKAEDAIEIVVDPAASIVDDTLVTICSGSEVNIVVIAKSDSDGEGTLGSKLRLDLAQSAVAHVSIFSTLHDGYQFLSDIGVTLADNANVDVRYFLLGGGLMAAGLRTENVGYKSAVTVDARYLGLRSQTVDMNYTLRLRGRKTVATLDAYGILADNASKTLRDTIDLVRGCKGAVGNENETVLLAGHNVVNKSLPIVLCDEDDVVGNHGATIGSISDDQLDYLHSRGLDDADCDALFSRAILDAAVSQAPTQTAREAVLAIAQRILGDDSAEELISVSQKDGEE